MCFIYRENNNFSVVCSPWFKLNRIRSVHYVIGFCENLLAQVVDVAILLVYKKYPSFKSNCSLKRQQARHKSFPHPMPFPSWDSPPDNVEHNDAENMCRALKFTNNTCTLQ